MGFEYLAASFLLLPLYSLKIKKERSRCEQSCQAPAPHTDLSLHVTEYLPPSHPHLQPFHFSSLSFSFIPHSLHGGDGRSFAFCYRGREGKVRPSPLLCLLLSFLSSVPPPTPPSLPLHLYTPHLSLPPSFCLWHTAIGLEWSEVRKGEGGTHARHWTSDPSTRWTFCCRLPISSDTPSVCFPYNNPGFFAFSRTRTQGLKKQQQWSSLKSFVKAEICQVYGSDCLAAHSFSLLSSTT